MHEDLLHYLRVVFSSAWVIAGTTILTLASLWEVALGSAVPGWLLLVGLVVVLLVAGFRPWRQAIHEVAALERQLTAPDESPFALLRRRAARCGFDAAAVIVMNTMVENNPKASLADGDSQRRWWLSSVRELAGPSAGEVVANSDAGVLKGDTDAVVAISRRLISILQARDARLWSAFSAGKHAGLAMLYISNDGRGHPHAVAMAMDQLPEISENAHTAGLSEDGTRRIIELLKSQKSDAIREINQIVDLQW